MSEVAARGRGVVAAYGRVVALDESDFTVPAGELTAIIGPNGSGKSTLLHLVTGLVRPRRGTIEVLGTDPVRARRRVAYVLQTNKVNEAMPITVREVVAMGRYAELGPLRPFTGRDRLLVDEALERMDIADLGGRHLSELSGGQRQRVFVAQGLAQRADLLLLDEPVTGLDLASRRRIIDVARAELARGVTVVYTTHDLADAGEADHVLLLAGRVVAEGPPAEVLRPELLTAVYGVRIVRLPDGSIALDEGHHDAGRHVHFERGR